MKPAVMKPEEIEPCTKSFCNAEPTKPCVTKDGYRATESHQCRLDAYKVRLRLEAEPRLLEPEPETEPTTPLERAVLMLQAPIRDKKKRPDWVFNKWETTDLEALMYLGATEQDIEDFVPRIRSADIRTPEGEWPWVFKGLWFDLIDRIVGGRRPKPSGWSR